MHIKVIKHIGILMILLCMSFNSSAQQDPSFTQYMFNTMTINPAYAGTRNVLSASILHRSQWLGIDGAPETQTLSVHSPFRDGQMGIGLNVVHDRIGPATTTRFNGNYSYILPVDRYTSLSLGVSAGADIFDINFSDLNIFDPTDPNFQNDVQTRISPQVGLGAMLYNDIYYVSLSVPKLLRTKYYDDDQGASSVARERLHYYLTAGYVFDINENVKLKPSILTRVVSGAPLRVDLSANFLINDKFSLGGAYRLSSAFSVLSTYQISDTFMVGFSYDRDTSELVTFNDGSFEIFFRYELFKRYKKMYTPRFF
ncbi:MAG: type IX secretion system membrane protein PorP/SprF [Bacteroidetes bacterium]|nr:type IX secretion system membrane protein PorP/SprF [Bacteroidota bacterium]